MTVTAGMKEHLESKLIRYEKYAPRLVESHVLLKKQKYIYEAEITLLAKNLRAFGQGKSKENVFTAIDQAAERVEKQLKKYREKRKDHHKIAGANGKTKPVSLEAATPGDEKHRPRVIQDNAFAKPMTVEEASLQLELLESPFLVFRNAQSKKINVIFKRKDGNHGLLDPEF